MAQTTRDQVGSNPNTSRERQLGDRSIGVVILNFNTLQDSRECLRVLFQDEAVDRSVLVIDNGSLEDEARPLVSEFGARAFIIRSPTNLGFARGCNLGAMILIKRAIPKSLLFLNSDATIPWADVEKMYDFLFSTTGAAAVGPNIVYPDRTPQTAGGMIDFIRGEPRWYETPRSSKPYNVEVLHGSAMLVSTEAWTKIGSFDTDYFSYSEETDWCVRAVKGGWRLFCVPGCVALHKARGSSKGHLTPFHVYLWARNRIMFMRKQAAPSRYPLFW